MNGQREPGQRRYSPSLRVAAEALYGTRAKPALAPVLQAEPRCERAMTDNPRL
ncbi:hypothetical protein KY084_10280 [Stakelama sp. CBK3Z-3]|uniref:Transposase n=1 Tax=Stakelama flava TaxID=2860338 RepID=A0ABS6XNA4_9SPHN|nr:hypothetical protein [Stakelama flava]MBW4331258.1 hypothetical protein [Stakelama flava]